METGFIDLHTHTNLSDGKLSPEELIRAARKVGIRVLAITDHNAIHRELPRLRQEFPDMELPWGCEVSCREEDIRDEIHVVGLFFDPEHPAMVSILQRNRLDRRPRIEGIFRRLREECGLEMGTYEQLQAENPDCEFVGRAHIAQKMVRLGYVKDTAEAYDVYIGNFGQKRAFVEKNLDYIPLEHAVAGILTAGGVAILAHPLYYRIPRERMEQLVAKFSALGGQAMEVRYAYYTPEEEAYLQTLADRNGLEISAGSDYHGIKPGDFLGRPYPRWIYEKLKEAKP